MFSSYRQKLGAWNGEANELSKFREEVEIALRADLERMKDISANDKETALCLLLLCLHPVPEDRACFEKLREMFDPNGQQQSKRYVHREGFRRHTHRSP